MSINFPAQPCTTLWEHLFYSRLNWWWKSLKMMEQGVLTHACNPNTWGARVGEPGVHAPLSVLWKSSHGGGGPANLLMEEDTSFKAPYLFLEVVSWRKRTYQSSHGGSLFLWLMKKIYIWSGCRKKSPLWRLIGFRPLWKQIDPSYSLLARLISSVAAQSHYWALFFFSPLSFTIE